MKNNLIVILCFTAESFETFANTTISTYCEKLPQFLLYALVIQVGLNLGANAELGKMVKDIRFSSLLLPFFTIIGTLVFSAAASLLLTSWNIYDCMAVGSGFAIFLITRLIVQLKEASAGIEIASQLGAIALLANIIREMLALFRAPLYASSFCTFAPVSRGGNQFYGYLSSRYQPVFRKEYRTCGYYSRDYPRDQRAVAYLALLQVEAGFILNTRYKHKRGCVHYIDASSCSFIVLPPHEYLRTS